MEKTHWRWLGKRIAATLGILYAVNFIAVMVVLVIEMIQFGPHSLVPDWFENWFLAGALGPIGVALVAALIFGMVKLARYWTTTD